MLQLTQGLELAMSPLLYGAFVANRNATVVDNLYIPMGGLNMIMEGPENEATFSPIEIKTEIPHFTWPA